MSRSTHAATRVRVGRAYLGCAQAFLLSAIALALLLNGSVSPPYTQIAMLTTGLAVLAALTVTLHNRQIRQAAGWTALAAALAAGWGLIQTMPLPAGWPAHPIWAELPQEIRPVRATISARPVQTLASLPLLIMPILVFAATLILCQSVRAATRFWTWLAAIGFGLTLLGIMLEVFFPETFVFTEFAPVGGGVFNGIFVNRNVTAHFTVLTAFALLGAYCIRRAEAPRPRPPRGPPGRGPAVPPPSQAALLLAVFVCAIALIATSSRAGTLLGLPLLTLSAITVAISTTRKDGKIRPRRLSPWMTAALVCAAGAAVLTAFGEPVLARLDGQGVSDLRACAWASTIEAIRDRPWTGSGFGTFADLFPAYRDPDCIGTEGQWLRAHNSLLEFVMGFGIVAVLLFSLGYALILRLLTLGWRKRRSLRPIPALTLGALLFVTGHSLLAFPMQIPGLAAYAAAILGAGCGISVADRGQP